MVAAEQRWAWPAAEFAAERKTAAAAFAAVAPEDSAAIAEFAAFAAEFAAFAAEFAAIAEFAAFAAESAAIVAEFAAFVAEFAAIVAEFAAIVAEFEAFVAEFEAFVAGLCCRSCRLVPKLTACPDQKSKVLPIKGGGVCRPNQPNRSAFVPRLNLKSVLFKVVFMVDGLIDKVNKVILCTVQNSI